MKSKNQNQKNYPDVAYIVPHTYTQPTTHNTQHTDRYIPYTSDAYPHTYTVTYTNTHTLIHSLTQKA